MTIGRVAGTVVGTAADPGLRGERFLLVEDCDHRGAGRKEWIVALDSVGADRNQLVLLAQGSSCHWSKGTKDKPVDALVVAIVDTIDEGGEVTFSAAAKGV